jgi:Glu-tRNA(Gln) amidotransferase subunit E-like FAD-binding protein
MTDVNVEENAEPTRDADGFIVDTDVLSFTVPKETVKEGATPGAKYDKSFTYRVCDSDELAHKIMEEKDWSVQDLVNRKLKADARSNAYQSESIAHQPVKSTVPLSEIKERLVRDFMRSGLSESVARAQVESVLAANNG